MEVLTQVEKLKSPFDSPTLLSLKIKMFREYSNLYGKNEKYKEFWTRLLESDIEIKSKDKKLYMELQEEKIFYKEETD